MIEWLVAALLVVGFVVLLRLFGLVEKSKQVVTVSRRSFGIIRSFDLSDEAKEVALQRDAKRLFRLFLMLALGGIAAVLTPIGLLWLCDQIGLISLESVLHVAMSPAFLITSGTLAILTLWVGSRKPLGTARYSTLERTLHRVAFKTCVAQVSLADIEDRVFAKRLALCSIDRPVFITALPRAGTTLLLECFTRVPEFASHCYRDMPFVLVPCLWSRFSAKFQQTSESRERAHGDGMLINFDSPEAFEEVLWKTFWRRHYRSDRIIPWQNEHNAEFEEFFRSHMRKIILLRRGENAPTARYVSKNNLNIARTPMLRRLFPDSIIVVPYRQPLHHAASLLEQHRNFLRIHEEDPFASEYMRAIGHFDFGKNLRPVDFGGWLDRRESRDVDSLAFWLEYWVATYKHLVTEGDAFICFLSYETLCENPEPSLRRLSDAIGSPDCDPLLMAAADIHRPRPRELDAGALPVSLVREASRVYANLREKSLN